MGSSVSSNDRVVVACDSHDSLVNLGRLVSFCTEEHISTCIWLGDLTSPPSAKVLLELGVVYGVTGNNDGDIGVLTSLFGDSSRSVLSPRSFASHQIGGRNVFLTHYPELARLASQSGQYDAVFYGHDHVPFVERTSGGILANPGALWSSDDRPSFGVWGPYDNSFRHVYIDTL